MAGRKITRARKEAAAKAALEALKSVEPLTPDKTDKEAGKYTPELALEIVELIATGVSIDNACIGDKIVVPGIEDRVGVSARTIYRWQRSKPDFAAEIEKARLESSHRIADKIQALSEYVLLEPAMSHAVRTAQEGMRYSAEMRNRATYGQKSEIKVKTGTFIDALKRIEEADNEIAKQAKLAAGKDEPDARVIH